MKNNKLHCDFCGKHIPENDENCIMFLVENFIRCYCSDCKKYADNIQNAVVRKVNYYKQNNLYYEIEHIFKMVESLYKSENDNFKIYFKNNCNYGKDAIGIPIKKDNVPIGYISEVNKEEVTGIIWNRYMPIIAELHENKVSSFEIVY